MRCRETIFFDSSDIKTIIAQFFDTEECNVDIIVDNDRDRRSVQVRIERARNTAMKNIVQVDYVFGE